MGRQVVSRLNFKQDMTWGYIEGYRRAAHVLRDRLLLQERDVDFLIYPLGYLYRHHIELQLKWLIVQICLLRNEPAPASFTHKISQLWIRLQDQLTAIAPDEKHPAEITAVLAELSSYDDSGQNFRYAKQKDGTNCLSSLTHVEIDTFCSRLDAACEHLEAIHWWLLEKQSFNKEFERHFQILNDPVYQAF